MSCYNMELKLLLLRNNNNSPRLYTRGLKFNSHSTLFPLDASKLIIMNITAIRNQYQQTIPPKVDFTKFIRKQWG